VTSTPVVYNSLRSEELPSTGAVPGVKSTLFQYVRGFYGSVFYALADVLGTFFNLLSRLLTGVCGLSSGFSSCPEPYPWLL